MNGKIILIEDAQISMKLDNCAQWTKPPIWRRKSKKMTSGKQSKTHEIMKFDVCGPLNNQWRICMQIWIFHRKITLLESLLKDLNSFQGQRARLQECVLWIKWILFFSLKFFPEALLVGNLPSFPQILRKILVFLNFGKAYRFKLINNDHPQEMNLWAK